MNYKNNFMIDNKDRYILINFDNDTIATIIKTVETKDLYYIKFFYSNPSSSSFYYI